jgi:hypothetical protein
MDSPAPWWQGKNDKGRKFPRFNPDSEEGTTKVTKQHEIRSPWGFYGFSKMVKQARHEIPHLS